MNYNLCVNSKNSILRGKKNREFVSPLNPPKGEESPLSPPKGDVVISDIKKTYCFFVTLGLCGEENK